MIGRQQRDDFIHRLGSPYHPNKPPDRQTRCSGLREIPLEAHIYPCLSNYVSEELDAGPTKPNTRCQGKLESLAVAAALSVSILGLPKLIYTTSTTYYLLSTSSKCTVSTRSIISPNMGIFKHKKKHAVSHDPLVTYHITQSLSGKLTVSPVPTAYHTYSIVLSRPKGFRDTIDVAVHRSPTADATTRDDVAGHCLIQVVMGKFLDCRLGDGTEVSLRREGMASRSYSLDTADGRHSGFRWLHDVEALGGRTTANRRLKLEDADGTVVARFAGAATGVSEFGMLEIYSEGIVHDVDWCGLLVLTAVCVYAREERNREKSARRSNVAGFIGNWGGLFTLGIPVGGSGN